MQIPRGEGETLRVGQIKTLTTDGTEHTEGETRKKQITIGWINLIGRASGRFQSIFPFGFFRVVRAFRGSKRIYRLAPHDPRCRKTA